MADPIRVRVVRREPRELEGNARQDFWAAFQASQISSDQSISQLESRLCRELGSSLKERLISQLNDELRGSSRGIDDGRFLDLDRFLFKERDLGYQMAEVYSKYLDYRLEMFRQNPSIREAQQRLALATSLLFSVRIAGYGSLDLDLAVGSIERISKVFESNFDSFRVFLDVFVPVAFGNVLSEDFADQHKFEVKVPASIEAAFEKTNGSPNSGTLAPLQPDKTSPAVAPTNAEARERAEWLWRLANGSLLIPLVIALFVMYFGLKQISEMRANQYEMLKPILQHQLELLKEDRLRFSGSREAQAAATSEGSRDSKSPATGESAPKRTP